MEKTKCLIIFENTMNQRYLRIAKIHGFSVFEVNLNNNLGTTLVSNLRQRIVSKPLVIERKKALLSYLSENKFDEIYFSNAEGFICKNILPSVISTFPNALTCALQHGIFPLSHSKLKEFVVNITNGIFNILTGFYPIGAGFGGIKLDRYYVYSNLEKQFLTQQKGWREEEVFVDIKFIKADLYAEHLALKETIVQDSETAIFLLQGLSLAGVCTKENEEKLILETINYLSNKFKIVLLKDHPACEGRLKCYDLPKNTKVISSMSEGFSRAKQAYSFFSTALVDAKVFELTTTGIISEKIKIDTHIYDNFDVNLHFEKDIAS